jgi:hypothetical protein
MAIEIPRNRLAVRQIQTTKRNVPLQQIIDVQGQNPLAQGIEVAGGVIGQTLQKRAELQRQGIELAKLESLGQVPEGTYAGLQPETARTFATTNIKNKAEVQEEARKISANTLKVRALESQFGYKPNELGDDPSVATMKVQNDLSSKRQESGPAMEKAKSIEKGRYRNYLLDMEQRDLVIKEINKQGLSLAAVDSLGGLVNEGNTVAFSALGLKMAKAMGEVGVMTEQDIKRYVTSGMLPQKAADTLSIWLRGRPTEATLEDVNGIAAAMKTAFQEKAQPRYDRYINSYANIEGITPQEFATKLSLGYGGKGLSKIEPKKPTIITPKKVGRFQIEVE